MLWQNKVDRAMSYSSEQGKKRDEAAGKEPAKLEKGDVPAMLISAAIVIVPAVVLAVAILLGAGYLFLFH